MTASAQSQSQLYEQTRSAQADDDVVEETESFESFDDFITEADAIVAEPLVEVEAVAETVAEPEPSNDWGGWTSPNGSPTWKQGDPDPSEAEAEPKSKKKRKKKISFV